MLINAGIQKLSEVLARCFGSLLHTTTTGATILFLFLSRTTSAISGSTTWSRGVVGNGRETRSFGIFPSVVIESAFDIDPDGGRHYLPSRFSLHADPIRGICFLGAVALSSCMFSLILYPIWRHWVI